MLNFHTYPIMGQHKKLHTLHTQVIASSRTCHKTQNKSVKHKSRHDSNTFAVSDIIIFKKNLLIYNS